MSALKQLLFILFQLPFFYRLPCVSTAHMDIEGEKPRFPKYILYICWFFSRIRALGYKPNSRLVTDAPKLVRAATHGVTGRILHLDLHYYENRMASMYVS